MKNYNVTLGGTTLLVEAGDETEAIRLARLQVPDRCGSSIPVVTEAVQPQLDITEILSTQNADYIVGDAGSTITH